MKRKWGTFQNIPDVELQTTVTGSTSVCQVLRAYNLSNTTGNHRTFWKTAKLRDLSASHLARGGGNKGVDKTEEHKLNQRVTRLAKYGITLEDCRKNQKLGLRWCAGHKEFSEETEFSQKDRHTCKRCCREQTFTRTYNLPFSWYKAQLEKQSGVCAICHEPPKNNRILCLDHNHDCCSGRKSCGKCARALLCHRCNVLLGWAEKDVELTRKIFQYISQKSAN